MLDIQAIQMMPDDFQIAFSFNQEEIPPGIPAVVGAVIDLPRFGWRSRAFRRFLDVLRSENEPVCALCNVTWLRHQYFVMASPLTMTAIKISVQENL